MEVNLGKVRWVLSVLVEAVKAADADQPFNPEEAHLLAVNAIALLMDFEEHVEDRP